MLLFSCHSIFVSFPFWFLVFPFSLFFVVYSILFYLRLSLFYLRFCFALLAVYIYHFHPRSFHYISFYLFCVTFFFLSILVSFSPLIFSCSIFFVFFVVCSIFCVHGLLCFICAFLLFYLRFLFLIFTRDLFSLLPGVLFHLPPFVLPLFAVFCLICAFLVSKWLIPLMRRILWCALPGSLDNQYNFSHNAHAVSLPMLWRRRPAVNSEDNIITGG